MRLQPSALLALLASAVLSACGGRPEVPRAAPLGPEHYVIAPDDVPAAGEHIRYAAPGPGSGGLDVAVTEYEPESGTGPRVILVGVIHVADAPYFEAIQSELDRHPLVLYEAIKPEGVDVATWISRESEAGGDPGEAGLQEELASWFGFLYQLHALDYSDPRFVHADMTLEQFLEEGGDELLGDLSFADAEGLEGAPELLSTWASVRSFARLVMRGPIRSKARRMFAETMGSQDIGKALDMFPRMGELVLRRRNEVAMEILQQHLADDVQSIAVFYGAAHMPDLEARLERMGYQRAGGRWLRAWALRAPLPR